MSARGPVTAFAPGGVGNVGPGLDILGLAVDGAGDTVRAEWSGEPGIRLRDAGHPSLPLDPARHTSALAGRAVLAAAGERLAGGRGIALSVTKGLPSRGGQGGSAASAVAGAVAVNALLGLPLDQQALLDACLIAEETVAGRHLDNIAPSLLGGVVLIRCMRPDRPRAAAGAAGAGGGAGASRSSSSGPPTRGRSCPARSRSTSRSIRRRRWARWPPPWRSGDYELLGRAIDDRIAEPARAGLLPGFLEAKAAALAAGALGSSISGSGPTAFALARGRPAGERVAAAMVAAYAGRGPAQRGAGGAGGPGGCEADRADRRHAVKFRTERPESWQVCLGCGNETTELDPHPRCIACGGLLEVRHRPPKLSGAELIERFTERRGQHPGAPASGVWRFREVVLPSAGDVVSHPEGNTPLLHRHALDRGPAPRICCSSTRATIRPDRSRTAA